MCLDLGCLPAVSAVSTPVCAGVLAVILSGLCACLQVFQDVLGIESFTKSDEAFAAEALFLAYQAGDAASIQKVVQVSQSGRQSGRQAGRQAAVSLLGLFQARLHGYHIPACCATDAAAIPSCLLSLQAKGCFKHMDASLARMAVKLPQGDVSQQGRAAAAVMGGRDPNKTDEQQEEEDLI